MASSTFQKCDRHRLDQVERRRVDELLEDEVGHAARRRHVVGDGGGPEVGHIAVEILPYRVVRLNSRAGIFTGRVRGGCLHLTFSIEKLLAPICFVWLML